MTHYLLNLFLTHLTFEKVAYPPFLNLCMYIINLSYNLMVSCQDVNFILKMGITAGFSSPNQQQQKKKKNSSESPSFARG